MSDDPVQGGVFEFAFPHSRGEPWWLTDGRGYGLEVSPLVWLYYRIGRKRRTARFNRRLLGVVENNRREQS